MKQQQLCVSYSTTLSFRHYILFVMSYQVEQHRRVGRAEEKPVKLNAAPAKLPIGMCRNQISDSG